MALRLPKFVSRHLVSRWRQFIAVLSLLLLLAALLFFAAPQILSSHSMQNRLKSTLSTSLQGAVNWDSLQLSWTRGLQLHNFTVGPTNGALYQLRLSEVDCRPGIGFGSEPADTFGLSLFLRLHDLQLELISTSKTTEAPPPTQTEETPDPLTTLAQGLERFTTLSWPLPIDLRVDIAVTPVVVNYHDPVSNRRFRFTEGELQLRMPSLERAPLTFSLNGKVAVDDHPLEILRLATEITGLTAPTGRIVPAGALLAAFVDFPGVDLKADGRLDQEQGLQGTLKLDLPQLQQFATPFLPSNLPDITGTLLATLQARIDNKKNLALSCTLAGQKLQVDTAGPLDFDLGQQLKTDFQRQLVTLGGGVLMVPGLLEANWEARVEEPGSPERRVNAKLHQLRIDLDQALALAAPFLPPDLPQLSGGELQLQDLELQLSGSQGAGEVRLTKGTVDLQSLRQADLFVDGIALATSDLIIPLSSYFPASVAAGIDWQVASIDMRGAQPLTLTGLAGFGNLAIAAISKSKGEEKLSAKGRFDHKLGLKGGKLAKLASLSTLANDLQLSFALLPDGRIRVEELALITDIAALNTPVSGKELQSLPLRQTLQVAGVELRPGDTIPVVESFIFSLVSPEFVNVTGEGSLSKTKLLTVKTQIRLELPRFIAFADPLLPEKLTASGSVKSALQLTVTLPERPLPAGHSPLRSAKNALNAIRELHGSLELDDVELRLPLTNGSLHLSGMQTSQPFSLQSSNHGDKIDLGGAIAFDLRSGSVINGQVLPAEHARISFSGEVRDWDRAFLSESVQIEPLGLAQHSELTITGLAALLDQSLPPSPATLLQRLDATLFSEVDLHLRPAAPPLLPDLILTGTTSAGTRIDLKGADFLRLHAYADAKELALTIPDGPELHGLQARFNLDRTLQISTATTRKERWLPLSTSLVQPQPRPLPALLEGARRRLHDDRRGSSGGERSLTIQSLTLPGLSQPLTIRSLEAEIVTGQEEVGMNFLQAELLGGTLRSRALLDLRPIVPVLSAEALFTNLDLSRLNRDSAVPGAIAGESSISGEGFLRIPLLEKQRPLLEGMSLSTRLRQIGAKSFDRILASLDPHERNEAIQAQRKLLRRGQLQGIEVLAADGALAVSGAVNVQGASIALPRIDRLRLAELPLDKELAPVLTTISAARPPLEFLRADTIVIDAQGEISLRKEDQ
ncbi:MAG: hypothetical protein CVU69_09730 [Deltaproteobacteria bacterium HGW-Deltaproteobacteria-4]|nr:MAG: hypothetical protein CVU69_09730 [Deltaproteobacteria bacterium HGW-Deltaproteobacteria-4]